MCLQRALRWKFCNAAGRVCRGTCGDIFPTVFMGGGHSAWRRLKESFTFVAFAAQVCSCVPLLGKGSHPYYFIKFRYFLKDGFPNCCFELLG